MKQSISGAWLLMIVLVFMSIFIAYICISINYSHAFKLKTSIVTTIEQYSGMNDKSINKIYSLMTSGNYTAKSPCPEKTGLEVIGVNGTLVEKHPAGKFNYCVYREHRSVSSNNNDKYYYTVHVFLDFQLPLLGNLFEFNISGETNAVNYPNDKYFTN